MRLKSKRNSEIVFDNSYSSLSSESEVEDPVSQALFTTEPENIYFSLDLQIPKPCKDQRKKELPDQFPKFPGQVNNNLPKFGFVDRLETIFNLDLRTNNPWLKPDSQPNYDRERRKKVRIRTVEIQSNVPELPNCRKNYPLAKLGQLHAPHCKNAAQETAAVIGDHAYQNRQFIMQDLEEKVKRARL